MDRLIKKFIVMAIILLSTFSIGCLGSNISKQLELLNSAFSGYEIDTAIKIVNDNKDDEKFMDECLLIINNYIKKYKLKYEVNEIDEDTYIKINELAYDITQDKSYEEIIKSIESNQENMALYDEAIKLIEEKDYMNAVKKLKNIDSDNENYNKAVGLINEYATIVKEEMVNEINTYVNNKSFTEAIEKVNELSELFPKDDTILAFKSEVTKYYDDYKKSIEINNQIAENKRKEEEQYNKAYEKILAVCKKLALNEHGTSNVTITCDGTLVIDGNEYYSFLQTINDISYSDSKKLVKKSDYSMYEYYCNGDLFLINEDGTYGSKITTIDNPIEISIGELCKNQYKYTGQYVRITGIINYIDEGFSPNHMILVNDRKEYVHISYIDDSSYLKGDLVTVTGLVISTTSDFSVNGIPITMPSLDFGKIN